MRDQEVPEIVSWEQWTKHREYINTFSRDVMLNGDPTSVYLKANDYYKDGFYKHCDLDACGEYRSFIRTAREASRDGILTPQELVEITQTQMILKSVLAQKDNEFKKKFGK